MKQYTSVTVLVVPLVVFLLTSGTDCQLTCLSGDDVPDPKDATKIVRCGPHEKCSLIQYITPLGFVRNKMECKDKLYCGGLGSSSNTNTVICSECCDTDLCATQLCGNPGWPSPSGPICYHCEYPVTNAMDCGTIKTCGRDEFCGVNIIASGQYEVKCRTKDMCNQALHKGVCAKCCGTQLCNSDCSTHTSCSDDSTCPSLLQAFKAGNKDLCLDPSFKFFCNASCGMCPTTTIVMTSTVTSPSTVTTSFNTIGNSCSPNPCTHGQCTPQGTGHHCSCNPGYIGANCNTVDPCTPSPCQHGSCTAMSTGGYQCTCDPGYAGKNCDSAQPCTPNPCIHGQCGILGGTSYQCTCNHGYLGVNCDTVDPCLASPCQHGSCTTMSSGSYQCTCDPGYAGKNCDTAQTCTPNPCIHGQCGILGGTSYQCTCNPGYVGVNCDTVDPCLASPCQHGSCTTMSSGGYQCTCDPGYAGSNCDTAHSCSPNPCIHGQCSYLGGTSYQCTCNPGYLGVNCDKVDQCTHNPCQQGACHSTPLGGYTCMCKAGYTGTVCDTDINECSSNPCMHSGTCLDRVNSFVCLCESGYTGKTCDQVMKIRDCKDLKDLHSVSAANDDIYLIDIEHAKRNVKCDMTTSGGGWTILLNRDSGTVDFNNKDSTDYALGFGDVRKNYWMGLEDMHSLTSDGRKYQLRVEMTDQTGQMFYEVYNDFSIGPAPEFKLHVGNSTGTAGDSLSGHNGFGFTTRDVDHDSNKDTNCAHYLQGGWWFHTCYDSCLTCPYDIPGNYKCRSMSWNSHAYCVALASAKMMVRPM